MPRTSLLRLKVLRCAYATCALVGVMLPASAAGATASNRIVVTREPGLTVAQRAAVRDHVDGRLVNTLPTLQAEVIAVPAGRSDAALQSLRRDARVRSAEPDVRVHALTDPALLPQLYGLQRIEAPAAWPFTTGTGAEVAVVDTGITFNDPELHDRIAANSADPVNGIDDDGNGKRDDARGWDFVDADNSPDDGLGHGTFVAGIIAAHGDLSGVAPDAHVLPLRALNDQGEGYLSDVAAAFDYAGTLGVPIVNASLGMRLDRSPTLDQVFSAHPHTLYVTAAGNDGTNNDLAPTYPCASQVPNVLCVGASDREDRRAWFSNVGRSTVDLFAPGVDILSTLGGSYAEESGTSFAAPHVAGVAALLSARSPELTALQFKNALLSSADHITPLEGLSVTGGRVNALRALSAQTTDGDGDGIATDWDVCNSVAHPLQADSDRDGIGDACEPPSAPMPGSGAETRDEPGRDSGADAYPTPAAIERIDIRMVRSRRNVAVRVTLTRPGVAYITVSRRRCNTCKRRTVSGRRLMLKHGSAGARLAHGARQRFPRGRYRVRVQVEDPHSSTVPEDRRLHVR